MFYFSPSFVNSNPSDSDQGIAPMLSKFWLPLEEFTEKAMEGLCSGNIQIPVGRAQNVWDKFEKGKLEAVEEVRKRAAVR